jgi:hypothetical protein
MPFLKYTGAAGGGAFVAMALVYCLGVLLFPTSSYESLLLWMECAFVAGGLSGVLLLRRVRYGKVGPEAPNRPEANGPSDER